MDPAPHRPPQPSATADPRFAVLFEPVPIGPVTAPNRFFQVPHCNGMGHVHPSAMARMREIKAEGGWGVVSTEEVEIHPSSEFSPYIEGRLWDDRDMPALARVADGIHRHGALAAIELAYNGYSAPNLYSREIPLSPSGGPVRSLAPISARAMTLADLGALRQWHRQAALRARAAGFDIVYVYAGHGLGLPMHFLSRALNQRTDAYGGSLENRARLLRELLEDTRDAVGDRCAVALRLSVVADSTDDEAGCGSEMQDLVHLLAEVPDLWDVCLADWASDSATARFAEEGFQERHTAFVRRATRKPVVGVGRFTSPDAMVAQIRRGVLDLIGAARPSIADPFLPAKIRAGDHDAIRECIGCNICVSGDLTMSPIRCTQNPTMGEEWRRGWHPERIPVARDRAPALIVGAGPAGLECARALAQRGVPVTLVDASAEAGGRVARESRLPGLASWRRVVDYRMQQLRTHPHVQLVLGSPVSADDILDFGAPRVILATGARWRADGSGRASRLPVPGIAMVPVWTPDQLLDGELPQGPVLIYDDDHYYMGGVLAERLRQAGAAVRLVTPAPLVSAWTEHTLEQGRIQARLHRMGVEIVCNHRLSRIEGGEPEFVEVFSGARVRFGSAALLMVTARSPEDALWNALQARLAQDPDARIRSLAPIGDCLAPGTIAAAVYAGHRTAREWDCAPGEGYDFARELPRLAEDNLEGRP